jgi:hypothetical protein
MFVPPLFVRQNYTYVMSTFWGSGQRPSPRALYTEEDVRAFVQPGTSREAIIKRFGEPLVDDKNPKFEGGYTGVDEIMFFHLPFETQRRPRTDDLIFSGSRRSFVHHFVS